MRRDWTFCSLLQKKKRNENFPQLSEDSATGQQDYYAFAVGVGQPTSGSEVDLKIGGVMLPTVLIDSGASCNVIDQTTWEVLKKKTVQYESKKSSKKLFANGQKDSIEMIGTFVSEIVCEISGNSCVDKFTVVKGPGRPLLGNNTAEKLGMLRVGPDVCSLTAEGSDADIREKYIEVFTGVRKLKDFQLKLHIKDDVKPVAQPVQRLPFGLRAKVDKKLHDLLAKDIIEEVLHTTQQHTQLSGCCHWLLSQRQMVTFRFAWTWGEFSNREGKTSYPYNRGSLVRP